MDVSTMDASAIDTAAHAPFALLMLDREIDAVHAKIGALMKSKLALAEKKVHMKALNAQLRMLAEKRVPLHATVSAYGAFEDGFRKIAATVTERR